MMIAFGILLSDDCVGLGTVIMIQFYVCGVVISAVEIRTAI